ncbi:MAG: hypothetical protein ILO53_01040 [Clostridia bacterium]|nr:hypothetical protein [Clostridia bacterium]
MSLLDIPGDEAAWRSFYEYKQSLALPKKFSQELQLFIDEKRYLPIAAAIRAGRAFPLPRKAAISKSGADRKRMVYTYPKDENTVLKLLTYRLLRKYDGIFAEGLFSFRPGRNAKGAVKYILRGGSAREQGGIHGQGDIHGQGGIHAMHCYKVDIQDYFNSIPAEQFLPMLESCLADDPELYGFLAGLLSEDRVLYHGETVVEKKGIMAGTPLSAFYANLYLSPLDRHFEEAGVLYARYSDDIIVFAETGNEIRAHADFIRDYIGKAGLSVNSSKEYFYAPGEGIVFLGFLMDGDRTDVAPVTIRKLKAKMRRKRDALARWAKRRHLDGTKAAKAFVKVFNRKLFDCPDDDNELSWSRWFFPIINTTESLAVIDRYAEDCIRYLVSGRHTKARFNVRYGDIKALGFRSLVNEYYKGGSERQE